MGMFTQRHYIAVARALKESGKWADPAMMLGIRRVELELIRMFKADSAKFDPDKFARATKQDREVTA